MPGAPVVAYFPHAGGAASSCYALSAALAPNIEALAIQYPGRQDRMAEPPITSIDDLAEACAELLVDVDGQQLTLFGHSMGAVVAFEVARRLEQSGNGLRALIVSGRRAPTRHHRESVAAGDDDTTVLRKITALGGTDRRLLGDPELLALALPVIRADYQALRAYRYRSRASLRCRITAVVGAADSMAPVDDVRAWADHTIGGFGLHVLPGGHFSLFDRITDVASILSDAAGRRAEIGD